MNDTNIPLCEHKDSSKGMPQGVWLAGLIAFIALSVSCLLCGSRASGAFSLVVLIVFLASLFKAKPLLPLKYLGALFSWGSTLLGCAVVEYSTMYLSELAIISHYSGCLPLYCFSCLLFFVALVFFDGRFSLRHTIAYSQDNGLGRTFVHFGSVALTAIVVVMFLSVITRPAFLLGLDRFAYGIEYSSGILGGFSGYLNWLIVIPMMAYRNGEKKLGASCVIVYCLYLLWTGTKFGGYFVVLCYIPLVFYDHLSQLSWVRVWGILKRFAALLLTLILVAVMIFVSTAENKDASTYVTERVAQQGQLWWRTYDLTSGMTHLNEVSDEVYATVHPKNSIAENVGSKNGIYKIMYFTAPSNLVDNKLAGGSRYSSAGYAAAYYYFGFVGPLVFSALMAFLMAGFANLTIRMVLVDKIVLAFLCARLFRIYSTASSMFLFSELFEPVSLLTYALLAIYLVRVRNRAAAGCAHNPSFSREQLNSARNG